MAKTMQDFEIFIGNDRILTPILLTDPVTSNPIDLTGATVQWFAAETPAASPLISLSSPPPGVTLLVPLVDGKIEVALLSTATALLTEGEWSHEARITSTLGSITTVFIGTLFALPTIGSDPSDTRSKRACLEYLVRLKAARDNLMTGDRIVSITNPEGDRVDYAQTRADLAQINQEIAKVEAECGIRNNARQGAIGITV